MRKLFFVFLAVLLLTPSAFAYKETADHGPQEITTVWIEGAGTNAYPTLTSGSCVVLYTSATSLIGKQVTASTTQGQDIYGIYTGETRNVTDMSAGMFVNIQTRGYVPVVYLCEVGLAGVTVTSGCHFTTSALPWRATTGTVSGTVSGHTVAIGSGTTLTECGAFLK